MGRPGSHLKDAAGRTKTKIELGPTSSPSPSLQKEARRNKIHSKYASHIGMVDKRPKSTVKGGNLGVNELLTSLKANLGDQEPQIDAPKRGDRKRQIIAQTMSEKLEMTKASGVTSLLPSAASVAATPSAVVPTSRRSHAISRNARNQVVTREGQMFASVHSLPLNLSSTPSGEGESVAGFGGQSMDPFELVNNHLNSVLATQALNEPTSQSTSAYISKKTKPTQSSKHAPKKPTKRR